MFSGPGGLLFGAALDRRQVGVAHRAGVFDEGRWVTDRRGVDHDQTLDHVGMPEGGQHRRHHYGRSINAVLPVGLNFGPIWQVGRGFQRFSCLKDWIARRR